MHAGITRSQQVTSCNKQATMSIQAKHSAAAKNVAEGQSGSWRLLLHVHARARDG